MQMNMTFYEALTRVETKLTTVMAGFSSTFAPIKDKSAIEKLVLDLVSLGYGLLAAPVWNIGMRFLFSIILSDYFANILTIPSPSIENRLLCEKSK